MKALCVVLFLVGCSASQDAGAILGIDCGQDVGTFDGGGLAEAPKGLAEAPRSLDAGAGIDTCPDAQKPAERTASVDSAPAVDTAPAVDSSPGIDGEDIDTGADAEQCPNPKTIPILGNCMICGDMGGPCCRDRSCASGAACNTLGICVVQL